MGIVNSFINQIGREMGKDAYRSFRGSNSSVRVGRSKEILEEPLLERVINFELMEKSEATLRQLSNIVELAEHADPEDFEWQELFIEIDNKIDFCRVNLHAEFHEQLDRLDEVNAKNFTNIKDKHLAYIDTVIVHYNNKIKMEEKKPAVAILSALVGLRPFFMKENSLNAWVNLVFVMLLFIMFALGFLTYVDPIHYAGNLPKNSVDEVQKIKNMGLGIVIITAILYALQLLKAFIKIKKYNNSTLQTMDNKNKFVQYKEQLLKS